MDKYCFKDFFFLMLTQKKKLLGVRVRTKLVPLFAQPMLVIYQKGNFAQEEFELSFLGTASHVFGTNKVLHNFWTVFLLYTAAVQTTLMKKLLKHSGSRWKSVGPRNIQVYTKIIQTSKCISKAVSVITEKVVRMGQTALCCYLIKLLQ